LVFTGAAERIGSLAGFAVFLHHFVNRFFQLRVTQQTHMPLKKGFD